uniref:hypothetical protein n=1 Tax=Nonomuraea sp. CA-251285 TaxID=3240002 RepID=UPI003F490A66
MTMAFTVQGYIAGVAYSLSVGDGQMDGTERVMTLLEERRGLVHSATPTGPTAELDFGDLESILIALMDLTQVAAIEGDVPELYEPGPSGSIY